MIWDVHLHQGFGVGNPLTFYDIVAVLEHQYNRRDQMLMPRQLTREEFESEPQQSRLWRTYGDYNGYCTGSWNQFLALERFRLETGGRRRREAIVYDVRFVRYDDRP